MSEQQGQDAFEDLRAVLSGSVRDPSRVASIAARIADESSALARRISRAVEYARRGLRLEACAEAEAEPTVHSVAARFLAPEMRRWSEFCAHHHLPAPQPVNQALIDEIDEAIALTAPMLGRLARLRLLVLSDAPAWTRLEVLRELIRQDPENAAWCEDRDELELVAAAELNALIDQDLLVGNLHRAQAGLARLEDGKWHHPVAGRLAAQCRRRLEAAHAQRATVDAASVVQRIESEWGAADERGVRSALAEWDALAAHVERCGGAMPVDLSERVAAAAAWLSEREWHAKERAESAERNASLRRSVEDPGADADAVRAALRAAEEGAEGAQQELREAAESRIAEFERRRSVRRFAQVAAITLAAAGLVWLSMRLAAESEAGKAAADRAARVGDLIERRDFAEAERLLNLAQDDPALADDAALRDVSARLSIAKKAAEQLATRFRQAMTDAGEARGDSAKPSYVDEAERIAKEASDAGMAAEVDEWRREHRRWSEGREAERLKALADRARALGETIDRSSAPSKGKSSVQLSGWKEQLAAIRLEAGRNALLAERIGLVEESLKAYERALAGDIERERQERSFDGIRGSAADLGRLEEALRRHVAEFPHDARSVDLAEAARWIDLARSAVDWRGLPAAVQTGMPPVDAALVLDAARVAASAQPPGPFARACEALVRALGTSCDWRSPVRDVLRAPRFERFAVTVEIEGKPRIVRTWEDPTTLKPRAQKGGRKQVITVSPALDPRPGDPAGKPSRPVDTPIEVPADSTMGPSPEKALAAALKPLVVPGDGGIAELRDAMSALRTVLSAPKSGVPPAVASDLVVAILEPLAAGGPEPIRSRAAAALRDIGSAPADPRDAERHRWQRVEASVRPDQWTAELDVSLSDICRPLGQVFVPVAVLVRGEGSVVAATPPESPAAGLELWVADAGSDSPTRGTMVRLGRSRADGMIDPPDPAFARRLPVGTPLLARREVHP